MKCGAYCLITIGLIIVFGIYRKKVKPTFVKVIWVMITLLMLSSICQYILYRKWVETGEYLKATNQFQFTDMALSQVIHWLFAVEYFTVVSNFPLIRMAADPDSDPDEIDAKVKRAKTVIRVANAIFYTLVVGFFLTAEFSARLQAKDVYLYFDSVNKLISALLFVFSILKFRRLVKSMQSNSDFFASERLMTVHLAIFLLYIVGNFGFCVTMSIY